MRSDYSVCVYTLHAWLCVGSCGTFETTCRTATAPAHLVLHLNIKPANIVVVLDVGLSRFAVRAQPMFALRLERQATSPRSCTMLVQLPRRLLPMCTQFGVSPFAVPSGSSRVHSIRWLHHGPSVPLASRGYNAWYVCGGSVWQCLWSGYRGDAHTHLLLWPQVLVPYSVLHMEFSRGVRSVPMGRKLNLTGKKTRKRRVRRRRKRAQTAAPGGRTRSSAGTPDFGVSSGSSRRVYRGADEVDEYDDDRR